MTPEPRDPGQGLLSAPLPWHRRRSSAAPGLAVAALLLSVAAADSSLAQFATPAQPVPLTTPQVQTPPKRVPAPPRRAEEGARWQSLKPAEREALAPLEREWPAIDADRKQKWIALAGRYQSLPPPERGRITERMSEWARLSPAERSDARLRFQEAKQTSPPERNARWQAYQQLPVDEKEQFAARAAATAARRAEGTQRRETASGPRAVKPSVEAGQSKANVVPNPALAQPPMRVSPTVVQAAPGATTRLITRPTAPPAHQQTGMPKIAVTPEFVNRSTLQPRRGPQAAAVVPVTPRAPIAPSPFPAAPRPAPSGATPPSGPTPNR